MLSRAGKLNLLLKHLEWLNINTFEQRKILQKTIYILREMGVKIRYTYNWYIHGPYSPQLADDAYEIQFNQGYHNDEIEGYCFKGEVKEIIERFKKLFKDREKDDEWLELIGSLLFLRNYHDLDDEKLKTLLLTRKEKFSKKPELVDEAIQIINKHISGSC